MLGPQVTHKRHLAGSTRIKSSSPTIKGRPFPVCLLLSLAQVRPVTIASAIPASPSRRVSHAAFSYSGRYCAITFQSTKVSPLPYRVTNKFGYKKSRGFSKSSRTRRCDSTHRRDKARHRPWPVTAHTTTAHVTHGGFPFLALVCFVQTRWQYNMPIYPVCN